MYQQQAHSSDHLQQQLNKKYPIYVKYFIGGILYSTKESDIESYFNTLANSIDVAVIRDKNSGKSRGFAFVTFAVYPTQAEVEAAKIARDRFSRQRRSKDNDSGEEHDLDLQDFLQDTALAVKELKRQMLHPPNPHLVQNRAVEIRQSDGEKPQDSFIAKKNQQAGGGGKDAGAPGRRDRSGQREQRETGRDRERDRDRDSRKKKGADKGASSQRRNQSSRNDRSGDRNGRGPGTGYDRDSNSNGNDRDRYNDKYGLNSQRDGRKLSSCHQQQQNQGGRDSKRTTSQYHRRSRSRSWSRDNESRSCRFNNRSNSVSNKSWRYHELLSKGSQSPLDTQPQLKAGK